MPNIQEFFTSRNNGIASADYVGREGRLWFDPVTATIRVYNGQPGGALISSGGGSGSTAVAAYQATEPTPAVLGLLWFDSNAEELKVYGTTGWTSTGTTGSTSLATLTDVTINLPTDGQTLIYDSATSKFVNTDIKLTGGTGNQILVKKSATDYDYQWEELIVDPTYTKLIDDSVAGVMYLGEAAPTSTESTAVWRIQKIIFDTAGNVDEVRYAAGGNFDQVWNDRTGLVYL